MKLKDIKLFKRYHLICEEIIWIWLNVPPRDHTDHRRLKAVVAIVILHHLLRHVEYILLVGSEGLADVAPAVALVEQTARLHAIERPQVNVRPEGSNHGNVEVVDWEIFRPPTDIWVRLIERNESIDVYLNDNKTNRHKKA